MEAVLITCIVLLPIILIVASYLICVKDDTMDGILFLFAGSIPVGITTLVLIAYAADKYL